MELQEPQDSAWQGPRLRAVLTPRPGQGLLPDLPVAPPWGCPASGPLCCSRPGSESSLSPRFGGRRTPSPGSGVRGAVRSPTDRLHQDAACIIHAFSFFPWLLREAATRVRLLGRAALSTAAA